MYLDYNATTPIDPQVAQTMLPLLETHGNPSSAHPAGRLARKAVETARGRLAGLLGARPGEIIFTSGGSEANNLALKGLFGDRSGHLVISALEHPAISEVAGWLEGQGVGVTVVGCDGSGLVDPEDVAAALRPETRLVSIMHAQNEVGTLQPIAAIATVAHRAGALLHTDAAQSLGKVPVRAEDLGVDLLSVAGHKFYGPKGVGALWLREGVTVEKQIHGAGQERGLRAGTENVLLIAGLGAAAELAAARLDDEAPRLARLRDALEDRLLAEAAPAVAHGRTAPRLPNTCSIGFPGLIAADLMGAMPEVECSAGSACNADGIHVSPVLQAMGVGPETAAGTLRLSLGRFTTEAEVDRAGAALVAAVGKLRG